MCWGSTYAKWEQLLPLKKKAKSVVNGAAVRVKVVLFKSIRMNSAWNENCFICSSRYIRNKSPLLSVLYPTSATLKKKKKDQNNWPKKILHWMYVWLKEGGLCILATVVLILESWAFISQAQPQERVFDQRQRVALLWVGMNSVCEVLWKCSIRIKLR